MILIGILLGAFIIAILAFLLGRILKNRMFYWIGSVIFILIIIFIIGFIIYALDKEDKLLKSQLPEAYYQITNIY